MADVVDHDLIGSLQRLPLFVDLPFELIAQLATRARRRRVGAGEVLCAAGELGDEFYVIVAGVVRIVAPAAQAPEVVAELGPGEWFGEMALITGEPRAATALAATDLALVVLARSDFQQLLGQLPKLGVALSHVLSRRLRAHLQRRPDRAHPSVIAVVTSSPVPSDGLVLANLAVALADAGGLPVAIVDHIAEISLAAVLGTGQCTGVTIVDDDQAYPAALCAEHPLLLSCVTTADSRTPILVAQADAVWSLDAATTTALATMIESGRITEIRCETTVPQRQADKVLVLEDAVRREVPIVRKAPGSASAVALRRFARRVLGRRIGLALSAGGAKGLAHVGALRCFERAGIEFDLIAGTSMGGIVGGMIALGRDSAALIASFADFARNLRRTLLDFAVPEVALLRGEKKRAALLQQTGDRDIHDLTLPFWTVAADLVSGREVVFGSGPLSQALDATSAIPAVFPPVVVGSRVFVDGWVVNPLPADILRREGADIVIAVDTSAGVDPTMHPDAESAAGGRLRRWRQRLVNPAIVRVVMRAMEVGAHERTVANLALVDACVQPDLAQFSVADVRHLNEIVDRGDAATEAALPLIREALRGGQRAVNSRH